MRRLALATVVLLAACSAISEGVVIDKWTEEARTYVQWMPIQSGSICSGSGTSQTCTPIYIYIPYQMYDDEDYVIKLRNCVDDEGDCREGQRYIGSKAEWEAIAVDTWWSDEKQEGVRWANSDPPRQGQRVSRSEAKQLPKQPPRSGG